MGVKSLFLLELDSKRIYGLDILRSFAILFVMLGHSNSYLPEVISSKITFLKLDGVTIFFVLSGFLIGQILIKVFENSEHTFKTIYQFWIRRWYRTLPAYFLILFVLMIIDWDDFNFRFLFFIQNLFYEFKTDFFLVSWSLSIEEWFYLLIPILLLSVLVFTKISVKNALLIVSLFVILFSTYFRWMKFQSYGAQMTFEEWDSECRKLVFSRLDSIMFGVMSAWILIYKKEFWEKKQLLMFILGVLIAYLSKFYYHFNLFSDNEDKHSKLYESLFSFPLLCIGTMMMLPLFYSIKSGKGVLYVIFTYISLISYSLYLTHSSIVKKELLPAIKPIIGDLSVQMQSYIFYFLFWVLSFAMSILIFKYFEKPMTELREKHH